MCGGCTNYYHFFSIVMNRRYTPIDHNYENDLERYAANRSKYRGIYVKDGSSSFYALLSGKYIGSRKSLDEIYQLLTKETAKKTGLPVSIQL